VLGYGFGVEIKRGRGLSGPCVVKDDLLKTLLCAVNIVFLGVKDRRMKYGVPLTLTFFSALAGWGVAIGFLKDIFSTNPNQWMHLLIEMLGLKQSHRYR
jgi:hypothetical protein